VFVLLNVGEEVEALVLCEKLLRQVVAGCVAGCVATRIWRACVAVCVTMYFYILLHMLVWLDARNVTALKYQSGVLQRVAVFCSVLQCVFTLLRMRVCGRMHTN